MSNCRIVERIVSTLRPGPLGQTARNLRLAAAGGRQAAGPVDDVLSLLVGKLAEPRTASHALLIRLHEAVDAAPQKADALAAVEHQPPAHQAQLAPTRNGLGRNIELLGQLFDREHLLADVVGRHVGRIRQILDEQPQIVPQIVAGDFARRRLRRPITGDAEADVFVGIRLLRIDLGDQPLGSFDLLELLNARREPDLLIAKFA